MTKKLLTILFLSLGAVFCSKADPALPVLKVSFPAQELVYEYYIQGEMTLEDTDGEVITLPAKFKTRGATARQYSMKPSFNMKLEGEDGVELDTDLLGIRKASSWILDAMAIDRICMRNRVCFDIWNEYSRLPYSTDFDSRNGTKGRFLIVYMNGVYKGIYCLSDKINRKLLDLKKPKVEDDEVTIRGVLYKNGTTDIGNQETPGFFNDYMVYVARWHDAWELKEPDDYPSPEAWQPLVDYYDDRTASYVEQNFYEENLTDYSLLIMALCIEDNWGNKNKYFSMRNFVGSEADRKFVVTPWDLDNSLGGGATGQYYDGEYTNWSMSDIAKTASLPFSICFSNDKEKLKARWQEVRKTALSVESVASRMREYCDLFVDSGAWKEYVDYWNAQQYKPCYVEDLTKEVNLIIDWYAQRFDEMDEYFGVADAGVEGLMQDEKIVKIYNMQGLEVDKNRLKTGEIYIQGGKKFIMR